MGCVRALTFWLPRVLAIIDALHMILTLLSVSSRFARVMATRPLTVTTDEPAHCSRLSKLPHLVHGSVRVFLPSFVVEMVTSCPTTNQVIFHPHVALYDPPTSCALSGNGVGFFAIFDISQNHPRVRENRRLPRKLSRSGRLLYDYYR